MNVYEARVVVRERTVAEIVDLAVRFSLRLGGGLYARLCVYVLLPAYALLLGLLYLDVPPLWSMLTAALLFPLLQLPFTVAASRLMFSAELGAGEVLRESLRVLVRYTLAQLLGLMLLVGGSLLVVLAPAAAVRSLFLGEIVVLEGARPSSAYQRATRLTFHRFGQSLLVWVSLLAVSFAVMMVAEIFGQSLAATGIRFSDLEELLGPGLNLPGRIAGLFLSAPLVATLRFLAYIDNRTRREGWDIQVRFLELARGLEVAS